MVPMLLYAQDEVGHVSQELIEEVAKRCGVTPLQVDEVVGYYSMLHKKPLGKYHVQVCTNISCLLVGGEELYRARLQETGHRQQRSYRRRPVLVEEVECMGACSWAPAIQINYDFHHFVTPGKARSVDRRAEADEEGSVTHAALQRTESARSQSPHQAFPACRIPLRSTPTSRPTATRRS